jgi:hypothetical protein
MIAARSSKQQSTMKTPVHRCRSVFHHRRSFATAAILIIAILFHSILCNVDIIVIGEDKLLVIPQI